MTKEAFLDQFILKFFGNLGLGIAFSCNVDI